MSTLVLLLTGYSSGSPAAARPMIANLCKRNRTRAFAFQYRLGPQHTFPAILLDAMVAYLYLIAPPSGAQHDAVAPSDVVFVGESAGGSLSLALLQTILHAQRSQDADLKRVQYHGIEALLQVPGRCALLSPAVDWTFSMPSRQRNAHIDFLLGEPWLQADFPPDSIWPTQPPRGEAFTHADTLCHPLISPVACRDWSGAPPLWICLGEETPADAIMLVAQTAARQGILVEVSQYEGMMHSFPLFMTRVPQVPHCYDRWAVACLPLDPATAHECSATFYRLGELERRELDVRNLVSLTQDEALELMAHGRARKMTNVYAGKAANL